MLYAALDDSMITYPKNASPVYFSYAHAFVIGGKDIIEQFGWVGSKDEVYSHEKDIRSKIAFLKDVYSDMFSDDIILVGCDHYFQRYPTVAEIIDQNSVKDRPIDKIVKKIFKTADLESRIEAKRMMSHFLKEKNIIFNL